MTKLQILHLSKTLWRTLIALGCFVALCWLTITFITQPYWTIGKIENRLNTKFPDDAYDIAFNKDNSQLHLTFYTSDSTDFTENICGGVLHQGYDPFNAVEAALPIDNSLLEIIGHQAFYAHSIDTPMTTWGTRCWQSGRVTIRVIEENGIHWVELDVQFISEMNGTLADFVNPNFDRNLPLLIVGLSEENGIYRQVYPEICMRISYGYYNARIGLDNFVDDVEFFLGSDVDILIDEQPQLPISIRNDYLVLVDNDNHQNSWHCIPTDLPAGTHILAFNLSRPDGDTYTYDLDFIVE